MATLYWLSPAAPLSTPAERAALRVCEPVPGGNVFRSGLEVSRCRSCGQEYGTFRRRLCDGPTS